MIRKILFILFVLFASGGLYAQNGAIKGKVLDAETGEPIPFANVVVEQNGNQIGGGVSDFDGNYTVKPIPAGRFTVKASYVGYKALQINDVVVNNDRVRFLDLKLQSSTQEIEEVVVVEYTVPLIDKDNTQQGGTVTSEEISKMAGRSPESVASTVGGVYQEDGEVKSVRGAREDATVYYIDGVKVRGSNNLPKSSIAEVSVVTGGLPARYGDATGGVISITTKGASRTYFGGVEFTTSKFLDDFNENILGFNVSGPILTRSVVDPNNPDNTYKEPLLGFFVAGELTFVEDETPSAVGVWKAKDDILDSISRTPLYPVSEDNTARQTASLLHAEDFENVATKQNVGRSKAMVSGKLDFQPIKSVVLTVGGTFDIRKGNEYNFTSGTVGGSNVNRAGGNYAYPNQILNSKHNNEFSYSNWRTYFRLTQKFNNSESENALIKNAYYTIQADYSKNKYNQYDPVHKDNLFDYGYIGEFNTYRKKTYAYGYDTTHNVLGYIMDNYEDTLVTFNPGTKNPELSRYTELVYDYFGNPNRTTEIEEWNGLLNGQTPDGVYDLVQVPGQVYNEYFKRNNDQIRISALGSADIKDHEISMGFEYEKRTDREYTIEPRRLWQLAGDWTNFHISELDLANPIMGYVTDENGDPILDDEGNKVFNDTIEYNQLYNRDAQSLFDISLRNSLGMATDGTEWVDVNSIDPSELEVDFFSPDELFNNGNSLVDYFGYDAYGNVLSGKVTFEDFYTEEFEAGGRDGWKSRKIAPFEPIYWAGFIQDKFAFNDLIFNIGVRVDGYDANQKMLKDEFLLYETFRVGDSDNVEGGANLLSNADIPSNIPQGAAVYVDNMNDPNQIVGYRLDKDWYDAAGNDVENPQELYRNGSIQPYRTDPNDSPGDESFLSAFKDYEPQINVSPRISFSFPISDEALFFAHYDILTKRPAANQNRINPYEYLYVEQLGSSIFNNPGLKPEKTIDYELGFQQKLTNTSSLKLSAFYREQRDMVQLLNLVGAYPINMLTYGNIDFGTVKGFTAQYDLRRTRNVQLKASYTLQFANATGSDVNTAYDLLNSGQPNLRTALPTDFDQRHALSLIVDYRFADGKNYNGPKWFGTDIFANAGCNFVVQSGSGTPYTKRDINTDYVIGSINGSVMPWRTTINMKIDKSFMLNIGKDENARSTELNVYLDVSNLLDADNVLGVYTYTGNPDDDGYLSAQRYQTTIKQALDPQAYRNYYSMIINNPGRYSMPRRIRLGVLFSF